MNRLGALVIGVLCVLSTGAHAQSMNTQAEDSARAVMNRFGSGEALQAQGAMPLSTDAQMTTVDGATNFGAKVACRDSEEFLRVTMLPSGVMDIDQLVVEVDMDMDGTRETVSTVPGPFAGVCINGMVRCDPGTFNNCAMMQWRATPAGIGLVPSTTRDVGSCYCFNGSCGSNLLLVNNQKILNDVSSGIAQSMIDVQPRLVIGRTTLVDPMSVTQYGQLAACGTDHQPEQYYTNPAALPTAGIAAAAAPDSPASLLRSTPLMSEHGMTSGRCVIERRLPVEQLTKNDILRMTSVTRGYSGDCGPGCISFGVGGQAGGTYQSGAGRNACRYAEESLGIDVLRPDRIDRVNLTAMTADGYTRLSFNGTEVVNMQPGWTWAGVPWPNCPRGPSPAMGLSNDVTSFFAAIGAVNVEFAIAYDNWGDGSYHFEARVREGCEVLPEEIDNGCAAYEANPECSVMTETVDDVATVTNYLTTGLAPLPSDRAIGSPSCALTSGPRPWWRTERVYSCRTGTPSYDGREARRRANVIQGSVDMTSGAYTDERTIDGVRVRSDEAIVMPTAPYAPRPRTMVCKTVRPRPGIEIADGQAVNNLNTTGPANDFSFKECDDSGVCPLEPGETLVSGCAVNSNFAQAATMMQTVRLIGQDTQCVAP